MAGVVTVGQCEWADYPTKILEKHWPDVPRWRDIRTLTGESFYERTGLRTVDVISGGFPCQPFSVAGERRGKEDDRYLWPEMLRVIQEIRPTWVLGENVPGIINLALDEVLSSLENIGYSCEAFLIPACGVDAPHKRFRICILAYAGCVCSRERRPKSEGQPRQAGASDGGNDVADADDARLQRVKQHGTSHAGRKPPSSATGERRETFRNPKCEGLAERDGEGMGQPEQYQKFEQTNCEAVRRWDINGRTQWPAEPDVGRVAHGVPNRVDRIKCLGNAVVPQQFYPFFMGIAKIMDEMEEKEKWRE
jgi:DNA (cytosine-5)-methyltransferase 1